MICPRSGSSRRPLQEGRGNRLQAWGASVVAILVGVLLYSLASALSRYAQRRFD